MGSEVASAGSSKRRWFTVTKTPLTPHRARCLSPLVVTRAQTASPGWTESAPRFFLPLMAMAARSSDPRGPTLKSTVATVSPRCKTGCEGARQTTAMPFMWLSTHAWARGSNPTLK